MSKKMWRNSSLTFMRGWKAPAAGGAPSASKLYFLNDAFFHAPLEDGRRAISYCMRNEARQPPTHDWIISAVKSVSNLGTCSANLGPFCTE